MSLPLFLLPILCGLIAQGLKPLLNKRAFTEHEHAGTKLPRYGGMPSAHTAFATSLATLVAWEASLGSAAFAIAASLVIYVLDDALRMRMFLSRHGVALRKLISKLPKSDQENFPHLESQLGHKLPEVLAGAALGIILTLGLLYIFAFLTRFLQTI